MPRLRTSATVDRAMVIDEKQPSPEREQTDESLRVERESTDTALGDELAAVDQTADAVIEQARARADKVLAAARAATDRISVSDTGPGIPADQLEAVFARFRQVEKNDRRGVGLGLYISKSIVQGHGGRIWAESAGGDRTTVRFTLPVYAGETAPPPSSPRSRSS